jgi:hypothetical protein
VTGLHAVSVDDVGSRTAAHPRRALTAGQLAWVAAVPCALVVLAAVVAVGPWVGETLLHQQVDYLPTAMEALGHPEDTEHGQFVVALALAPLLVLVTLLGLRREIALPPTLTARLVTAAQWTAVAFALVCAIAQRTFTYSVGYSFGEPFHQVYFSWPTVAVAALLTAAAVVAAGNERIAGTALRLARETPARRAGAAVAAVALTASWLSTAVNTDASVGVNSLVSTVVPWSMSEPLAILGGLTPLVDFHTQYGQLLPWLPAAAMELAGTTVGVYTVAMATLSGIALLAVYAVLRRVTRSSLAALALFAPFLATSLFIKQGSADDRFSPANLFSVWPGRYFGPLLLLWLTARLLDGRAPRRAVVLFGAAGLVAINNTEFGLAALVATAVALVCAAPPRDPRAWARLGLAAAGGLLAALAVVTLLSLVAAGELPRLGLALEFARIYGGGFMMLPMPELGLHVVLYLTCAACLVVAAVRAAMRAPDRLLTGLLGWIGTFGLLIGAYFAGRSHPQVLIDLFGAWSLALCLLVVVVARAVHARPSRRPTVAEVAVLACFALCCCSLAQLPTPWSQIERIQRASEFPALRQSAAVRFVVATTRPGETVAILTPLGHRVALDAGVRNVAPYSSSEAMPTFAQLDETVEALRAAGGRRVFLWMPNTWDDVPTALMRAGFRQGRYDQRTGYLELVDARPAADAGGS